MKLSRVNLFAGPLENVNIDMHAHDEIQFGVLHEGTPIRAAWGEGSFRKAGNLKCGQFVAIPSGELHGFSWSGNSTIYAMYVSPQDFRDIAEQLEFSDLDFDPMISRTDPLLIELLRALANAAKHQEPFSDMLIDSVEASLLIRLIQHMDRNQKSEHCLLSQCEPIWLHRVIDFVDSNLEHNISLQDLADIAGFNKFRLLNSFKSELGQTPYQFVMRARLNEAKRLLDQSSMPIIDIVYATGFSSQSHFTSSFAKRFGVTPSRYRAG